MTMYKCAVGRVLGVLETKGRDPTQRFVSDCQIASRAAVGHFYYKFQLKQ